MRKASTYFDRPSNFPGRSGDARSNLPKQLSHSLQTICLCLSASIVISSQLFNLILIMFQRTLLRQAQAARSVLAASTSTSAPLALRRTTRLQSRMPAAPRPFAPQPLSRFYSTENNGEQKEAPQEAGENAEAEDPSCKELEDKKKEIVELKVLTF